MRLLSLACGADGSPNPAGLEALRRMSLEEAFMLEDVAHHRQWQGVLTNEALTPKPEGGAG